jgi:hypothetical protein
MCTSYEAVLTSVYSHSSAYINTSSGEKVQGAWENREDFVFFDGTINEPMPKRTVANAHYLNLGAQIAGLCITTFSVLNAIGCCVWVYMLRKTRLVAASQPEFLYSLCFGAALVAASQYFVSFGKYDDLCWIAMLQYPNIFFVYR